MEELRQDKFDESQRPKYTGREEGEEDRDLIGHLSSHDALAGEIQQAHFLAAMEANKVFVSSSLSLALCGLPFQSLLVPISRLECWGTPPYLQPHLSPPWRRGHRCVTQGLRVTSDTYVCGSSK